MVRCFPLDMNIYVNIKGSAGAEPEILASRGGGPEADCEVIVRLSVGVRVEQPSPCGSCLSVAAMGSGKLTEKDNADSGVQFITPAGPRQSLLLAKDPGQFL